jgi:hypothetical protein
MITEDYKTKIDLSKKEKEKLNEYWQDQKPLELNPLHKPSGFTEINRSSLVDVLIEMNIKQAVSASFSLYGKDNVPELFEQRTREDLQDLIYSMKINRMYIFNIICKVSELSLIQSTTFKIYLIP